MKILFEKLREHLAAGKDAVLITIVASSGSTPRGAGARMLVTEAGRVYGTIGGGAVEYRSEQVAAQVLRTRSSRTARFLLRRNQVEDLGMICGGDVTVYFHFIPGGDPAALEVAQRAADFVAAGDQSWLITDITPGGSGALTLYGAKSGVAGTGVPRAVLDRLGSRPVQVEAAGRLYYAETLVRAGRVYLFGGGHVAQALVPVLAAVEFRCVVIEDREAFCRPGLFPGVEETRLVPMDRLADGVKIGPDDFICIMTRGHKNDTDCEAFALRTPACYIGVIGSRRKTAGVNATLRERGVTEGDLARIKTPIGLDIQAETPAEIAVSIAAELIQTRAARAAGAVHKSSAVNGAALPGGSTAAQE